MRSLALLALAFALLSLGLSAAAYLRDTSSGAEHAGRSNDPTSVSPVVPYGNSVRDAALGYYATRWQADGVGPFYDLDWFWSSNRNEVLETCVVSDSLIAGDIAAALVRYSIGGDVIRDVVWMRRLDGRWLLSLGYFSSSYDDDPFGDGDPARAKEIIAKAKEWEEASSDHWW